MNVDEAIKKAVSQRKQLSQTEESALCKMVKKDYRLDSEQQELLAQGRIFRLTREEACELLTQYVEMARRLAPENHLALFEVDNPEELLPKYFRTWSLSEAAELKLFELDPTGRLAVEYSEFNAFDPEPEIKFMTLPGIVEEQLRYVSRGNLHTRTRNALLKLVEGEQFIRQEMELRHVFATSTQVQMLKSPNAHEWMKRYTNYADLSNEAQMMLFKMHKPKKMVRLYDSRRGLCWEARREAIALRWL